MFENLMSLLERGVVALEVIAEAWKPKTDTSCACKEEEPVVYEPGVEPEVIDPPEEHPSVAEQKQADAAYLERETVKTELRKLGVKFKEAAKTETLQKLLKETIEKAAVVKAVGEDRKCCFPKDRDSAVVGDERILYCRECHLVHRKQDDFTGADIAFEKGERYFPGANPIIEEALAAGETVVITEPIVIETIATKDEARDALVNLSAAKGKDKALTILKEIGGAEKLSDVPEANYGKIVKACKEA